MYSVRTLNYLFWLTALGRRVKASIRTPSHNSQPGLDTCVRRTSLAVTSRLIALRHKRCVLRRCCCQVKKEKKKKQTVQLQNTCDPFHCVALRLGVFIRRNASSLNGPFTEQQLLLFAFRSFPSVSYICRLLKISFVSHETALRWARWSGLTWIGISRKGIAQLWILISSCPSV